MSEGARGLVAAHRIAEHRIAEDALLALRPLLEGGALRGAVVLGSGLSSLLAGWKPVARISGAAIPGYPQPSVPGHAGEVAVVRFGAAAVLVFAGRVHFYEGHDRDAVTFNVRLAAALGARWVLLTNASGSCDLLLAPGSALIVEDHVHLFTGARAARGASTASPTCGSPYHAKRTEEAFRVLANAGLRVARGVLYGGLGPNYETAAEVEMVRRTGACAACMSTVVEAEEAARLGLEVAGLSLVTNLCTGLAGRRLDHAEVVASGAQFGRALAVAVDQLVRGWCAE